MVLKAWYSGICNVCLLGPTLPQRAVDEVQHIYRWQCHFKTSEGWAPWQSYVTYSLYPLSIINHFHLSSDTLT